MAFLGLRKWPTPVVKPLWPFMIAGVITSYGLYNIQMAQVRAPPFDKDPKNPYGASIAKEAEHH